MGIFGKLFNSKIGQKIKNEFGIGEDQQNIRTIKYMPKNPHAVTNKVMNRLETTVESRWAIMQAGNNAIIYL